jgi:HAD superfamily hydrolase (TIGR01450 family)
MTLPTTSTAPFDLANYDACVFDLDGTVWLGATDPIPGAAEFLARCRASGVRVAFATNAIMPSPEELSERLVTAGLARPDEPIVTSGLVITRTLVDAGVRTVAAVIPAALAESLTSAGIDVVSPDDVGPDEFGPVSSTRALVMASSRGATIGAIERLGRLASAGHRLYLSSQEPGYPVTGGIEPGGGVLMAALRFMYDVEPVVLGKPSTQYASVIAQTVGGDGTRIAMIGDSQRSDVAIAEILGCDSVFLTRYAIRPIDGGMPVPTFTAPTLADEFVPFDVHVVSDTT